MEEKSSYQRMLEAQLKEWELEIEKLTAKAEKAKVEAQLEYHHQIEELRKKQQAAQQKLHELKQSADEAWKGIRQGAEHAMDELKSAFKKAADKFKA